MSGDDWGTSSDEIWGDILRLLRRWRAPSLGASSFCKSLLLLSSFSFYFLVVANLFFFFVMSTQLRSVQSLRAHT